MYKLVCDLCGKEEKANGTSMCRVELHRSPLTYKSYDLCLECYNKLAKELSSNLNQKDKQS